MINDIDVSLHKCSDIRLQKIYQDQMNLWNGSRLNHFFLQSSLLKSNLDRIGKNVFKKVYNGEKHCLTCAGTTIANLPGMLLGSRTTDTIDRTDPENTVAKKTFHIVNHNTLVDALLSISPCEMNP